MAQMPYPQVFFSSCSDCGGPGPHRAVGIYDKFEDDPTSAIGQNRQEMTGAELQHTENTIRFNARVVAQKAGEAAYLHLPKAASAGLPSPGTTTVEGTINGFPFRAPLQADGKSAHALRISKALQVAAGGNAGEMVVVELTRVGDEPEVRVPSDLVTALKTAAKARSLWTEITPMARRE